MKFPYRNKRFHASTLEMIKTINAIVDNYGAQGFKLSSRQVFYQLVASDVIPNKQEEYKRVSKIVSDARLAGLIDWSAIEDRTRFLRGINTVEGAEDAIDEAKRSFALDLWEGQDFRPEVWIEKDALVGIIEGVCGRNRVDYFSCRGYTSQSEMWGAAMRMRQILQAKQTPLIIHLGDHDPSGLHMTTDIIDRLEMFLDGHGYGGRIKVKRIALTMEQIEEYDPPPNPAKEVDPRFKGYTEETGLIDSWELDSMTPTVLAEAITETIEEHRDENLYIERVQYEQEQKELLEQCSNEWENVSNYLKELNEEEF